MTGLLDQLFLLMLKKDFDIPTVVYNLEPPIHSKIFNFSKSISNLDIPAILRTIQFLTCNCEGSQFVDKDHKHILTGNWNIVRNKKLRKHFAKGLKYRQNKTVC